MAWTNLSEINANRYWFMSRADRFNNYPLLISIFWRYPTTIDISELSPLFVDSYVASALRSHGAGYGGYDALLMANLAAVTNFHPVVHLSNHFGVAYPNGTFDGSLGDVLNEVVDISFNSRFVEKYGSDKVQFVFPVFSDKICVLAPSGEKIPSWTAMFRAFQIEVWLAIIVTNWLCLCVWLRIRKILLKIIKESTQGSLSLRIFSIAIAMPTVMPRLVSERLLIGSCVMANIIIVGTFQVIFLEY